MNVKRLSAWILAAMIFLVVGCESSSQAEGGVRRVEANAAVHHTYPMLDSLVIEYEDEVVLPDTEPDDLYSLVDTEGERSAREVTGVHTNNEARVRDDGTSVPGKYVIIQLDRVANPQPQSSKAWAPDSTAGRAILSTESRSEFRMDYSGVEIRQKFDAVDANGSVVQPAGVLPDLRRENVNWPDFQRFSLDNVLSGEQGDIHYSYYLPPDYDPSRRYPMVVTLPGYGGLLHSLGDETRGVNVFTDRNALAWTRASEDVIVLAPQLTGWDSASARQAIELTEYFLDRYAVDPARVYAVGYSAGGETMSRVLNTRAELFAAYVHSSSQWNGSYDDVVKNRLPVYVFMAQSDEYYGPQRARDVYEALSTRYASDRLTREEIERLVVLDMPDDMYFNRQGIYSYHGGGMVVADKQEIIDWVLDQRKR
ncbi:prolyl oligopeptidase family serine peptidase [Streptomyces phaeochromogenes]|uniref:Prolyl oligopeptidase family serine peptidase n=1 Tax=Streptomyces phaeochromogenes TaxID=1923 RepID=A0ABZ1HQ49_STRPH|nr:prolyl oligopeptidase family serine peptidase [Streptomyces phaeochromogenes]WSD19682.1 prolyl oligopeptidase family serine peptidase [Streptomyces phaeochromogenes]